MTESYGKLDPFLRTVIEIDGTDLLLTTDSVPARAVRGHAAAGRGARRRSTTRSMGELLAAVLVGDQRQQFIDDRDIDFAISFEDSRFRGNAFFQRGRPAIALRLMHNVIPTFDEIGLPAGDPRLRPAPPGPGAVHADRRAPGSPRAWRR